MIVVVIVKTEFVVKDKETAAARLCKRLMALLMG